MICGGGAGRGHGYPLLREGTRTFVRADRLISILMHLQVNRRMTSRELAEKLEVSQRTIHRDMEALSMAGVPVYAERGTGGGWFLPPEYRTDLTGMSEPELQTIFLAQPSRVLADLGLEKASDGALAKLLAALPSAHRRDAEYVRQRIHVDVAGWRRSEEEVPYLPVLQEAVWRERKLHLSYGRGEDGAGVERLVDPLGLVAKGSVWYLVAAVEGELRSYRVSRVRGASLSEQQCVRPPDFDLAAHWEESKARFVAGLPRYAVTARVDPHLLPQLRQAGRWSRIERVDLAEGEGWATVCIRFETEEDACGYVLSMGPRLEVLEPQELREKVMQVARATVDLYARSERASQKGQVGSDHA